MSQNAKNIKFLKVTVRTPVPYDANLEKMSIAVISPVKHAMSIQSTVITPSTAQLTRIIIHIEIA